MPRTDTQLATLSLDYLQTVVAIDSQSDEGSDTIPSTEGQRVLADRVARLFADAGCTITRDAKANLIASLPGRGVGAKAPPIALMVHLDTARGTGNPERLHTLAGWDGSPIPYPANPHLRVDTATYPSLTPFVGHTIVHGDGRQPFGLDDKLGLTHLLSLARELADTPSLPHPPLLLIGRPDEEIGSMEAIEELAAELAERGVRSGYTIDGILPFEINVQNFNAAHAHVVLPGRPITPSPDLIALRLHLGGVNTHGATAHAEGHRAAIRFASEILAALDAAGLKAHPHRLIPDPVRDCDAELVLWCSPDDRPAVEGTLAAIISPHLPRGASFAVLGEVPVAPTTTDATLRALKAIHAFTATEPGFPLLAEDSAGWQGYSHPYRATTTEDAVRIDFRLRDFDPEHLARRKAHLLTFLRSHAPDAQVSLSDQYVNMGPRLADRRDLVEAATTAGRLAGVDVLEAPIRGGTGVDPFLNRGIAAANLGTGYFAPESEKELTSLEMMVAHVRWLVALCGLLATR